MFMTEVAADQWGNLGYMNGRPAVIEVEEIPLGPHLTYGKRFQLARGEDNHAQTFWTHDDGHYGFAWIEVEGPARKLSREEHFVIARAALELYRDILPRYLHTYYFPERAIWRSSPTPISKHGSKSSRWIEPLVSGVRTTPLPHG